MNVVMHGSVQPKRQSQREVDAASQRRNADGRR